MVERAPLSNHQQILLACGLDDLLTLLSSGLVIVFNTDRALGLESADMAKGIIKGVNIRESNTLSAVDHFSRGINPGPQNQTGALVFSRGKDLVGTA